MAVNIGFLEYLNAMPYASHYINTRVVDAWFLDGTIRSRIIINCNSVGNYFDAIGVFEINVVL